MSSFSKRLRSRSKAPQMPEYNDSVLGFSKETHTIYDALRGKFDYDEIVATARKKR